MRGGSSQEQMVIYPFHFQKELSDEAIHLLFSANRWERANNIMKLLEAGTTLIVDRYCYSGVAFSASKGFYIFHLPL